MDSVTGRLTGKVAVVTGAGSGIGLAIARAFASQGARVHLLDVRLSAAAEAAVSIGSRATAYECDVASEQSVQDVFNRILAADHIDILVNNAGIAHVGSVEDTTPGDFDRLYSVNVKGAFHCIRSVIGAMKARRTGVILNIASIAASAGLANRYAYSMTKGAIVAMTLSVARDYLAHGIRCVSISPARIHTPFVDGFIAQNYVGREQEMFDKLAAAQPIGRMGAPDEVAHLAVYLCSDEAAFVTGVDYPLDGGFMNLHG